MAHYLKLSAVTVVGFIVAVVLFVGVLFVTAVIRDHKATAPDSCPHSSPNACDAKMASRLGVPQSSLPTIRPPASLRYFEGNVTPEGTQPMVTFLFAPVAPGTGSLPSVVLNIARWEPPKPGGPRSVTKHLGPLTYQDYSDAKHLGALEERTGDLEIIIAGFADASDAAYNALRLQLLRSIIPANG